MPLIAYPECGKILTTHGCRGGVRVEPWCDSPRVFASLPAVYLKEEEGWRKLTCRRASVSGNFVLAFFEEVETMEAAEALRGRTLYARREDLDLPAGTLLLEELKGLPVLDEAGNVLGTLSDVIHPGATDIYVVDTKNGEALVPAVPAFIRAIDAERGVTVSPIEGMFP